MFAYKRIDTLVESRSFTKMYKFFFVVTFLSTFVYVNSQELDLDLIYNNSSHSIFIKYNLQQLANQLKFDGNRTQQAQFQQSQNTEDSGNIIKNHL